MTATVIDHPIASCAEQSANPSADVIARLAADFASECTTPNAHDLVEFATVAFERGASAVLVSIVVDPQAPHVARARAFGVLARWVVTG